MKQRKLNYCFQQVDKVHKIYLYDDIQRYGDFNWETHEYDESSASASHFAEQLQEIPETDEIEIHFNSYGGEVDQGTAIYNLLREHKAHKTGIIEGVCHSIAFTIFQACDKRVMGQGTSAIIHDMSIYTVGNAKQLRETADKLDVLMESCIQLFMERVTNLTEDELRELMHAETVLTPQMALDYGLCDEVGVEQLQTASEVAERLTAENKELRQQIGRETEFQKQLVKFYQEVHEKSQVPSNEPELPKEPETKKIEQKVEQISTGFGAFFNVKKQEETK